MTLILLELADVIIPEAHITQTENEGNLLLFYVANILYYKWNKMELNK